MPGEQRRHIELRDLRDRSVERDAREERRGEARLGLAKPCHLDASGTAFEENEDIVVGEGWWCLRSATRRAKSTRMVPPQG